MSRFDTLVVVLILVVALFWLMNMWGDLSQFVSAELIVRLLGY